MIRSIAATILVWLTVFCVTTKGQNQYSQTSRIVYILATPTDSTAMLVPVIDGVEYPAVVGQCNGVFCSAPVSDAMLAAIQIKPNFILTAKLRRGEFTSLESYPAVVLNSCFYKPLNATPDSPLQERPIGSTLEGDNNAPYAPRKAQLQNWGWKVSESWYGSRYKVIAICKGLPR